MLQQSTAAEAHVPTGIAADRNALLDYLVTRDWEMTAVDGALMAFRLDDELATAKGGATLSANRILRFLTAAAFGASVAAIALWGLNKAEVLHVRFFGPDIAQMDEFADAIRKLSPQVERARQILRMVEKQVRKDIDTGVAATKFPDPAKDVSLEVAYPQLYDAASKQSWPSNMSIWIRVGSGPNPGYKVRAHSELCTLLRVLAPELIDPDPAYNPLPYVCRYFGRWNESGSKL